MCFATFTLCYQVTRLARPLRLPQPIRVMLRADRGRFVDLPDVECPPVKVNIIYVRLRQLIGDLPVQLLTPSYCNYLLYVRKREFHLLPTIQPRLLTVTKTKARLYSSLYASASVLVERF